jgi:hypothetical protein
MTIDDRLAQVFDLRGTPHNTRKTYTRCIHAFERFCGKSASEAGRTEVEQFLLHLVRERKLGAASHNVYAGALRFVTAWCWTAPR